MNSDDDDAPVYPLLGFSAGVMEGAVARRLDFATCKEGYASGDSVIHQFVMTPDAAIEIGRALLERRANEVDRGLQVLAKG
ncbi:MAG: hypothetical protein EON90_00405 [Brevundimonas sp.]|nr:MAG: hypothetical protein EON90_00405 [Brevundimonas sp.]